MRLIKLHFVDPRHLTSLLANAWFARDIAYLHPNRLDDHSIELSDPVEHHDQWDTEIVVLSKFATGIKRIVFPNTHYNLEFLDPVLGRHKGGLRHNGDIIIDSTDLQW